MRRGPAAPQPHASPTHTAPGAQASFNYLSAVVWNKETRKLEDLLGSREKSSLGSAPARPLCLLSARLSALGSLVLPERGPTTGRPATASEARVICLQSRRFHRL